jgi:hypothetical protein
MDDSIEKEIQDKDLGRRIAKDNAKQKIWSLEGYVLRNSLHQNG